MASEAGSEPLKTDKREMFCHEYIKDFNATQAGIRAGYAKNSARQQASDLLANPDIQDRIQFLSQKVKDRCLVDAEYVLRELKLQYEADVTGMMDPLGQVLDPADWPEDVKRVVQGFEAQLLADKEGNGTGLLVSKVRRTDRLKALELLGKHKAVAAFQENIKVEGGEGLLEAVRAGRQRAKQDLED